MDKKELIPLEGPPYVGSNNAGLTKALFYEESIQLGQNRIYEPVFTLYAERDGLISARKTFLEERDPTGYRWAIKYLNDYAHFKRLMKLTWFKDAYDVWMDELNELIRSEALLAIQEIVGTGNDSQKLNAAKYMAERAWEKEDTKRGRPSKAEVKGHLKEAAQLTQDQQEDLERISESGFNVIQGGKDTG